MNVFFKPAIRFINRIVTPVVTVAALTELVVPLLNFLFPEVRRLEPLLRLWVLPVVRALALILILYSLVFWIFNLVFGAFITGQKSRRKDIVLAYLLYVLYWAYIIFSGNVEWIFTK